MSDSLGDSAALWIEAWNPANSAALHEPDLRFSRLLLGPWDIGPRRGAFAGWHDRFRVHVIEQLELAIADLEEVRPRLSASPSASSFSLSAASCAREVLPPA